MYQECQGCGDLLEEFLYVISQRDDGTWHEKKDGSLPSMRDLHVCVDCLEEYLG